MRSYVEWKWQFARWRLDFRERGGTLLKVQHKLFNMLRRLAIVVARIWFRKYRREEPLDLDEVSSVLFLPNDPIGDLLLTSPLWHILKARKPSIRIGVMGSPRNMSLLKDDAEVDVRYDVFAHNLFERIGEVLRARRDRWDVVITTGGFFKPVRYALLMRFIARDKLTASLHESRSERLHDIYSHCFKRNNLPYPTPMIVQFQSLIERLFLIKINDEEREPTYRPRLSVREEIRERATQIRNRNNTLLLVQLHLEAKRSTLEWEFENVKRFVDRLLAARPDVTILLTASPIFLARYPAYSAMNAERCEIFRTKSVEELAALVYAVDLVVTPDTAVVHFAALARVPMIILFEKETEWMPYRAPYTIFTSGMNVPVRFIPVGPVLSASLHLLESGDHTPRHVSDHSQDL